MSSIMQRKPGLYPVAGTVPDLVQNGGYQVIVVAAGLSNGDIASQLNLSSHTAKTHVNRAMTKLVGHDCAQLVVID